VDWQFGRMAICLKQTILVALNTQTDTEFDLDLAIECRDLIAKSWQMYIPTQIGRDILVRKADFNESYGPTISFHTQ
jgi:hypothetical protein